MKKVVFSLIGFFGLALSGLAAERPNILYFYVDDMGWGSIGPNGQYEREEEGLARTLTPHLDRLAKEGVNFRRAYGCTVCSPARSSQQTGFHQGHTFADRNDPDNAKKAIRTEDLTMGDLLSKAGYVTGYWGKWGYGGSKSQENPTIDNIQTLPTSHGYQHVVAELHHVRAHTFFQPTLWTAPAKAGAIGGLELKPNSMAKYQGDSRYPDFPALQNRKDYPEVAYCDDVYAFAALDFVRENAINYNKSGQPFLGVLAVQVPHSPFDEVEQLPEWDAALREKGGYDGFTGQTKQWLAMVSRIDAHFGNILAALEDPNGDGDTSDSVADDTLVIYQSDNGGPGAKQDKVRGELNINGGLRGAKGTIFEGGIRVPTIMRWPAKFNASSNLKRGTSTDLIVDVTDLLPTFCELAGVEIPAGIDGVSLAPTLTGEGEQRKRDFVIHEAGKFQSIISGKYKLIRSEGSLELYDLVADHGESNDISAKHPKMVKELEAIMLAERVDEPKGFAVTYHEWTGEEGGKALEASNWSDYVYENAGIEYMRDEGSPQLSWVARIRNEDTKNRTAMVDANLEVLSLEVAGNEGAKKRQSLVVKKGVTLTGRNEIRVGGFATLTMNNANLSSARWIEVMPRGVLRGRGEIEGDVYNKGRIAVWGTKGVGLSLSSDYAEAPNAILELRPGSRLEIEGSARLSGSLVVVEGNGFEGKAGDRFEALSAGSIDGIFRGGEIVETKAGNRFRIEYSDTKVELVML
ncbi:MAG: sulfatase-like hydrolase/transferase [Verrucomicrobiota bacterium]